MGGVCARRGNIMSLWEYKVITSGKGGFATPALLEKFLNDLGREEWEIVEFHSQSDNFLAFTGLARRPTQRDWTLEGAAAAAAKAEADKLRAEFEAKFKAATISGAAAEEPATFLEEKVAPDDGFRKPVDTSRDADADADEEEAKPEDDWDKLTAAEEDELPTFFDAIKPHMRRNQRGPGMSVGVDYLAKKWDQNEDDLKGALAECGFTIPSDEDAKPEYLEFEGDLYWINVNRRGELWINTKEKPRPVFRAVKAQKIAIEEEPKPEAGGRKHDQPHSQRSEDKRKPEPERAKPEHVEAAEGENAGASPTRAAEPEVTEGAHLPAGLDLLQKIRPFMRRNRRGPGGSGSATFLSRALKCREADLVAGFKSLGLVVPSSANEKPVNVEFGNEIWWVNTDSRGNVWINGRDKKPGETISIADADSGRETGTASEVPLESAPSSAGSDAVPAPEIVPAATVETGQPLAGGNGATLPTIRPLLKPGKTGTAAAKLERVANGVGKSPEELLAALVSAGLAVPDKPREKPVFVEVGGEIYWLNRNAKGELWVNAKASKFTEKSEPGADSSAKSSEGDKKPRRGRGRQKAE
jgi:hypothetical protein